MSLAQAVILGVIQGVTEFLPVSSSGHLVVAQKLFGLVSPPVLFDILVHVGTLGAVVVFFFKELLKLDVRKLRVIIWGTVPAVIVGWWLNSMIESIFNSLLLVAISWLITAVLLLATKRLHSEKKLMGKLRDEEAFTIGLFQALAILPGVSRSGSTVAAGLLVGLKRNEAFTFSFLLAIPAIIGALVLQVKDLSQLTDGSFIPSLVGMGVAAITGFLALKLLKLVISRAQLHYFAYYCFFVSIALLSYLVFI